MYCASLTELRLQLVIWTRLTRFCLLITYTYYSDRHYNSSLHCNFLAADAGLLNMIESLAAFALAGNILQFLEAGHKATVILRQIWDASASDENMEIEAITQDVKDLSEKIAKDSKSTVTRSQDEKELQQLAKRCKLVADELQAMLKDLVVRFKGS